MWHLCAEAALNTCWKIQILCWWVSISSLLKHNKTYLFHRDQQGGYDFIYIYMCMYAGYCRMLRGLWLTCWQFWITVPRVLKVFWTQVVSGYIKERSDMTYIKTNIYMQFQWNYPEVCFDILCHLKLHMARTPLLEHLEIIPFLFIAPILFQYVTCPLGITTIV